MSTNCVTFAIEYFVNR